MSILYIRDKNGNFVQMPSVPGKSAYEIAVAKGTFSGTEQEFAEMQVINNKEIIDQITQENIDNWNNAKGMTDEEKEQLANKIDKVELTDDEQLIFYSEDKEISRIQLQGGMSDEEKEQLNTKLATKFDDVALNENETNDMQTALDFYSEGKVVKTAYFTGGGGGGGIAAPYISTTLEENIMVDTDKSFDLLLDFVSPNPGKGTLKVFINDVESVNKSIGQGESITSIEGALFSKGTNRVVVYVLDRIGSMSNSLTFYVRYGSTEITSDFDAYSSYDYGATVRYYFTPTAIDTSLTLTFYMSIDGVVQQGVSCTSDTRGYYTFPNNLSADSHYCEAYIIDSNGSKSNVLKFNLIILSTNTLVIASDIKEATVEEGEQLSLDYKVYMKNNTSFITKVYVDNTLVNTGTCNADFNYYKTSSLTEGVHTVKLEVWDVTETYSDYITWTITVTPSTYEMLQPVNAGAMFIGTAVNKTNTDERKQYFIGQDQEGNEVLGTLTNFAFNSESGWVDDELIISGNSHVEIPIQPLANNARYGFTLDIEFTSKQIGVSDAEVLTLWNDETNCGVKITTEKLILRSSNGNQCDLYFTDNERTHVMFIIDRQELKAKIYLNGVMCEAFHLNDYTVDGVAYLDDFTVNSNIVLGGFNKNGYCKIRNLRVYQVALTTDEIINNFISCEIDKTKQRELVNFQRGNDLPTLYVYCDFSGLGKDDKKPCKIVYQSTNEELYGQSFNLDHKQSQLQYQGTSSMAYPIKNYRLNLRDENGKKWYYNFPGGQGECRFTLKADFMSSGHWTNTGMAKFINDNLYNYNSDDEKSMNPFRWYRVQNGEDVSNYRETINGFPCRLILVNDGETPLNEGQNEPTPGNTKDMGIFNFNNDKDNVTTLGFDSDIFPNCASYEVTANSDTSAGAFMSFYSGFSIQAIKYTTSYKTIYIKTSDFDTVEVSVATSESYPAYIVNYYDATFTKRSSQTRYMKASQGDTVAEINKSYPYFSIQTSDAGVDFDFLTINGIDYKIDLVESITEDMIYENSIDETSELAYLKESFELRHPDEDDVAEDWGFMGVGEEGTGLKALIDWVDNCTDEEFVADFEEHFHKDYTLRYYCLVVLCGMVDNMGKNMMLDTADNKIFFPRFYDIDTCCSYDNSGQLKFDVDIEMEQGYWNTSSSRLWTRIRDLMHDDIVTTYNNMRQNGVSYENMMKYIYDEQIAKIPQSYFNKDYDIKYAPFADSYIGMAHGDTYEHVKRWLKQRFTFVDTLFDYAPSYNNDVLTIRANTTELMTLEIETYTPVYQHLSWYNGQMDKKKIDGKVSVEFSGTAQAATDQEVLIYGGSNVKSIKGITSMNPNRMLIGSATKLVEIDAHDCPLLADINANKANLSPHEYLNKVNLSNCPLLEGNLRLNNSPLVQEINIKGTKITGINLPSSIRNLQILRLPNTMTDLTLNDASMLHTLEFDEGVSLQSISMTNCNALENVINFDLLQTPSITLNNSYNTVAELYFKDTTNLSLSNMSNLERVIFTPNNEYETFELINVANAPDYTVTTFNCPKLNTFMTTAPYRGSYNDCGMTDKEIYSTVELIDADMYEIGGFWSDAGVYTPQTTYRMYEANIPSDADELIINIELTAAGSAIILHYFEDDTFISRLIKVSTTWSETVTRPSNCNKVIISVMDSYFKSISLAYNKVETVQIKDYGDIQPNTTFTANSIDISSTQFTDVKLLCTTDTNTLKLPTTVKNFYCDSSFDLDTDWLEDGEYDVVHGELIEPYTTDYEGEVLKYDEIRYDMVSDWENLQQGQPSTTDNSLTDSTDLLRTTDYLRVSPGTTLTIEVPLGLWDYRYVEYDENKNVLKYDGNAASSVISGGIKTFTLNDSTYYVRVGIWRYDSNPTVIITYNQAKVPNLIPSSADGSLIFSMYAPSNVVAPVSGTWDLKGLEFDNFHTFGMNNDVKNILEKQTVPVTIYRHAGYIGTEVWTQYTGLDWLDLSDAMYTINVSDNTQFRAKNLKTGSLSVVTPPIDIQSSAYLIGVHTSTTTWISFTNKTTNVTYTFYLADMPFADSGQYDHDPIRLDSGEVVWIETDKITMPARYDDYNITIKNAHIAPKTHNTMLYPLLVNEDNPITGTLDYTNYEGKHLSWSFAYTDEEYVDIIQPKDELLNSYEYKYNAFYDTEYEFDNPYEIARYTSSASGVLPSFNTEFTYTYDEIDNGDGTYTTKIYADDLDNLPTSFSFNTKSTLLTVEHMNISRVTSAQGMFYQCSKVTYINSSNWNTSSITNMSNMFNGCKKLTTLDVSGFDTSNVTTMQSMFSGCTNLTSLDVSGFDTSKVISMSGIFNGCNSLTSLNVSGFDTGNVTNIQAMFYGCSNLTSLDVSGFDTSKVIYIYAMFNGCSALTSLDVSGFDTSNVTSMNAMFNGCSALTSLDVSGFDTSNVTDMSNMFNSCKNLTSLDVSGFDTSNVTTIQAMFYNCTNLTSLDVSGFNTSNVTTMAYMFNGCTNLTSLNVSGFDTSNVTTMSNMFIACSNLTSLDVSSFNTSNVTNMDAMFYGCSRLSSIDVSEFDTSKVTIMSYMFYGCSGLTSLDVSGFDTSKVVNMTHMFQNCSGLTSLNVINWSLDNVNTIIPQLSASPSTSTLYGSVVIDETTLPSGWTYEFDDINVFLQFTASTNSTDLVFFDTAFTEYEVSTISLGDNLYQYVYQYTGANKPTSISFHPSSGTSYAYVIKSVEKLVLNNASSFAKMFSGCSGLTSIDLSRVSVGSSEISMIDMFSDCTNLTEIIGLNSLDTSNVTIMYNMFYNCNSLTSLDVSRFDTSNVISMNSMFRGCTNLTSLDVSGFDTSNVTNMNNMFRGCNNLTSLDVSGFDTSKVTTMSYMFQNCIKLTSLDLSSFNTSNVTNMTSMFQNCSNLTSLDVSGFDTSNVTDMSIMFNGCTNLTSLDVSGFNTSNVTTMSSMFGDCSNLTSLNVSGFDTSKVTNMSNMFYNCNSLTSLDVSGFDTSNAASMYNMFYNCSNLTSLDSMQNISVALDLSTTILDATSLLDVITNLVTITTTQTLTLGSTLLAKLTEDQIAIATNKGWNIA